MSPNFFYSSLYSVTTVKRKEGSYLLDTVFMNEMRWLNEMTEWLAGVLNNPWSHPKKLIYTQMRKKWVYAASGQWRICFHQAQILNWIKKWILMQADNSHVFSHCVFLCGDNIADFWSQTTITWCCIDKLSSCCCFSLSPLIQFNEGEVLLDFFFQRRI